MRAFAGRHTFFSCRWNKINASSLDGTLFVATSVDATQSLVDSSWRWNKINASSRDGTLFVATSVDANAMQRNALCSVNSQTFRGARASVARVRGTARYASAIAGGAGDFAACVGVFAHAHYRFRKRALLVPSRCDLIPVYTGKELRNHR